MSGHIFFGSKITLSQPQVASESVIRNIIKIGVSLQQLKANKVYSGQRAYN